ncbi:hypothetical protein DFJ73DRAFT_764347 [Zopfochytrium polystomum]|nr:hypothetical protein DFJ73DRAFT_764347 [Zopfochytrium polystomum]
MLDSERHSPAAADAAGSASTDSDRLPPSSTSSPSPPSSSSAALLLHRRLQRRSLQLRLLRMPARPVSPSSSSSSSSSSSTTAASGAAGGGGELYSFNNLSDLAAAAAAASSSLFLFDEPAAVAADSSLPAADKISRLAALFIRGCSSGDVARLPPPAGFELKKADLLDAVDEDGTPGLVYAACWGHVDVVEMLIDAGVSIDQKDNQGWTALVWACSNGHEAVARILIENGASKDARSNRGRSLKDLVSRTSASSQLAKILSIDESVSGLSTPAINLPDRSDGSQDEDGETSQSQASYESFEFDFPGRDVEDEMDKAAAEFDWEKCQYDQMFVFDESKLDHILEVAIVNMRPVKAANAKPVAANIIFLCASSDLLHELFAKAIKGIVQEVHKHRDNSHIICHWIASCTQLLYYIKRDAGLRQATFQYQATLAELIYEMYEVLVRDLEHRISQVLDEGLLNYSSPEDGGGKSPSVRFDNPITSIGRRRSLLRSVPSVSVSNLPTTSGTSPSAGEPRSPVSEIFNRIITSSELRCRSRAVGVRVNIGVLEDWCRENSRFVEGGPGGEQLRFQGDSAIHLGGLGGGGGAGGGEGDELPANPLLPPAPSSSPPPSLSTQGKPRPPLHAMFRPAVAAHATMKGLELLNIAQARQAMEGYKYEMGEPSFPEEVEAYVIKVADDIQMAQEYGDGGGSGGGGGGVNGGNDADGAERWQEQTRVLYDAKKLLPFHVPAFSGTDEDVGWAWSGATPFIPSSTLHVLDMQSLAEIGDGWDGDDA